MSTLDGNPIQQPGLRPLDVTDTGKRAVVAALVESSRRATERTLAAELAAASRDEPVSAVTDDAVRSAHVRLYHAVLPALDDAGFVSWDRSNETVTLSDRVRDGDADCGPSASAAAEQTRDDEGGADRRPVLDELSSREGSVSRNDLAHALAARETTGEPSSDDIDDAAIELHHRRLPRLADADLIEYDPESGTVTPR